MPPSVSGVAPGANGPPRSNTLTKSVTPRGDTLMASVLRTVGTPPRQRLGRAVGPPTTISSPLLVIWSTAYLSGVTVTRFSGGPLQEQRIRASAPGRSWNRAPRHRRRRRPSASEHHARSSLWPPFAQATPVVGTVRLHRPAHNLDVPCDIAYVRTPTASRASGLLWLVTCLIRPECSSKTNPAIESISTLLPRPTARTCPTTATQSPRS